MRALAAGLLVLLLLIASAPVAAAQSGGGGAFGPLPQAPPPPTPTPEAPGGIGGSDGDVSRETLFLIAGAVLLAFVLLGVAITRDARSSLTEEDRAVVEGRPASNPMRKQEMAKMKQRQREKTRRQKKARKKHRGANRG